jgi:hypothetical protein
MFDLEENFWLRTTSIGLIFGLGTAVAFAVGFLILYQVLSSDIARQLSEYATLKALGYDDRAVARIVVQQGFGFRNAMFDSQLQLINRLDADVFLISRAKFTLMFQEPFARHRLEQARAGVESAEPVYIEHDAALWKNASDGSIHDIRAVAFEPERCVFFDVEICLQTAGCGFSTTCCSIDNPRDSSVRARTCSRKRP